uniref:Complement factor H-related protein 1-like n=1 Tax=Phascolarctos cinereus TaxID=38626 RepID=A0A6P5J232_PHACI
THLKHKEIQNKEPCIITRQQLEEKRLALYNGEHRSVIILNNQSLEFSCAIGYTPIKPSLRTCVDGHTDLPTCISGEVGKCGPSPSINNGDILSFPLAEYAPESRVEYRCQKFYVLQGSQFVMCKNGFWTNERKCLEACIASKEMMKKNNVEFRWVGSEKLYSRTGEEIEFICMRGFHRASISPPFRARCLEGKINYPRCI